LHDLINEVKLLIVLIFEFRRKPMKTFFPYAKQSINEQDCEQIALALKGPMITRGEQVTAFEVALKERVGADFAVVFNSGSTALEAAYFAAEGGVGDRILTTPNSFAATVGPGMKRGMSPCFVDIDLKTGNMSLEETLLNLDYPSTRGRLFVVPVHFAGIAMDMKQIRKALNDPRAIIIEDAAHALGSHYPSGEKVGSCRYSDMTIFSFHPAKTITTGEGGGVTTNDPKLYERLLLFRNNGIVKKPPIHDYDVTALTGNYNFTDFQAALGLSQLRRLDQFIEKRRKLVKRYRKNFAGIDKISLFTADQDDYTAFHLMVIQANFDRVKLMDHLKNEGVGTQLHYIPLYHHSAFKKEVGEIAEYFPKMEQYAKSALSLPLYADLNETDVDEISRVVINALA
jgi:dTDP-4-amino-4,6-dideoxygalactose transaminase